jgi:hypothetical protein
MKHIQFLKKKRYLISFVFALIVLILNYIKYPFVYYLPFNIPGKQMAMTIPPFGIFIESKYQYENSNDPCSILKHEMVHWEQYKRMGLFSFHYNYLKCYLNFGRINNWMEEEAREPCKQNAANSL